MTARTVVISTPSVVTPTHGRRILAVLERQERSASWLARKTGKSPAYVSRVINGHRRPSAEFRAAVAVALDVPEALLFGEEAA